jgi:hypothetical protein
MSISSSAAVRPMAPRSGGGHEKTLKAVADKLGMDVDSLRSALTGGATMSSLAAQKGVSQDDLVSTIAGTLPRQTPDGTAVDTKEMATRIANGTAPAHHGHHRAEGAQSPSAQGQTGLSQGLDALSSALGISSSDLLQRLTDGTGIKDLLSQNPQVADQLRADQNRGAIVDGYA